MHTPNMQRLAERSMLFSRAYAGSPHHADAECVFVLTYDAIDEAYRDRTTETSHESDNVHLLIKGSYRNWIQVGWSELDQLCCI